MAIGPHSEVTRAVVQCCHACSAVIHSTKYAIRMAFQHAQLSMVGVGSVKSFTGISRPSCFSIHTKLSLTVTPELAVHGFDITEVAVALQQQQTQISTPCGLHVAVANTQVSPTDMCCVLSTASSEWFSLYIRNSGRLQTAA